MLTFKEYIEESQWMYHGTTKDFDTLKPDRDHYMIDRAIGSHFASDRNLADKFSKGLYGDSSEKGTMIKTQSPSRSKIEKIPQTSRQFDQSAIEQHVAHTVFSHPEGKGLFKEWLHHQRNSMGQDLDDSVAEDLHNHLSNGKSVHDESRFGRLASKSNSFRSYVRNKGGFGASMSSNPELKRKIVDKFLGIMKDKGVHGLSYRNTSPSEMQDVRGSKSYILFHPDEHQYPYFKE